MLECQRGKISTFQTKWSVVCSLYSKGSYSICPELGFNFPASTKSKIWRWADCISLFKEWMQKKSRPLQTGLCTWVGFSLAYNYRDAKPVENKFRKINCTAGKMHSSENAEWSQTGHISTKKKTSKCGVQACADRLLFTWGRISLAYNSIGMQNPLKTS